MSSRSLVCQVHMAPWSVPHHNTNTYVMNLARIKCFCDGFSKMFVNHKHKIIFQNAQLSLLPLYHCNGYADHIPSVGDNFVATACLPWSSWQRVRRVKGVGCLPQPHAGNQHAMLSLIVLLPNNPTSSSPLVVALPATAWRHNGGRAANWIASQCKRK